MCFSTKSVSPVCRGTSASRAWRDLGTDRGQLISHCSLTIAFGVSGRRVAGLTVDLHDEADQIEVSFLVEAADSSDAIFAGEGLMADICDGGSWPGSSSAN